MKSIPQILSDFRENEAGYIQRIIDDDNLVKREGPLGLTIANWSKGFYDVTAPHQLLAKGIVFNDKLELVSLPLLKFYNLFEIRDKRYHQQLLTKGLRITAAKKYDGTMIQLFKYKGKYVFTTRGTFKSEYTRAASTIALRKYKRSLARLDDDKTYVFELIHPVSKNVVNYGDEQDLVLLAVYDRGYNQYYRTIELGFHHPRTTEYNEFQSFEDAVEWAKRNSHDHEGYVLTLESKQQIVHRVKIKSDWYVEKFRMLYSINHKAVAKLYWPDEPDWEAFRQLIPEEIEDTYQFYYDEYVDWVKRLKSRVSDIYDKVDTSIEQKEFAMSHKGDEEFALIMNAYHGKLDIQDIAKRDSIYSGCHAHIPEGVRF